MAELDSALCHPSSWRSRRQGEAVRLSQPPEGLGAARRLREVRGREPGPRALSPAGPAAWLQQHSRAWEVTSAAPEAMAACRKQAAGKAGPGNLKQH